MPAAVESVGGSEGQSESQLQSVRASRWWLLPPVGRPQVERVGVRESQLAATESAPAGAYGPYQASGWASLSEKQKKC